MCSAAWLAVSGCITISPSSNPLSLRSLLKPNVQQANYAEVVEEEGAQQVSDPVRLKVAYARWMEEMGQTGEARRHYHDVAKEEPNNIDALLGLARLDLLAGNTADAERRLKLCLKRNPDNSNVQFGWGQFLAAQGRWQEAVAPYQRAMLSDPANKGYRHQLAIALVHAGDVESALPHFMQTVGDAEAHYNVALILKDTGNLAEAERQLTLALTKKPDLKPAQQWLAEIRRQRDLAATDVPKPASGPSAPVPITAPHFYRPVQGDQGHSNLAMRSDE